jgi:hypothetical protein
MDNELMAAGGSMPAQMSHEQAVVASGQTLQQVRASYATAVAVQQPRSLPVVQSKLLDEAMMAGDLCYYGWGAGKDKIEGPSIKLAAMAARCWGNCATEMQPMQETADAWIFTAAFIDLETGFTMTRQFRQSKKWTIYGKFDAERKDDIRFQIGQSKAIRNVIINVIPAWLIDKAIAKAKEGVRLKIQKCIDDEGLPAAVSYIIDGLKKEGVSEERLLAKSGVAKRTALDIDHIVQLRGDLAALQTGQDTAEAVFPTEAPGSELADGLEKEAAEKAKDKTKPTPEPDAAATEPDADKVAAVSQKQEQYKEAIADASHSAHVAQINDSLDNETVLSSQQISGFRRSLTTAAKKLGTADPSRPHPTRNQGDES